MTRKKLTKTQVKKKLNMMMRATTDLTLDKLANGSNSLVPMSSTKIIAMNNELSKALNRVK
tara:strand:+ start:522 stop:704 length:183 start_codon:yes stop_codon:yes gene_type:complete